MIVTTEPRPGTAPARPALPLRCRAARVADAVDLRALYADLVPEAHPALGDITAMIRRAQDTTDGSVLLVADLDGQVVGTCQLVVYDNPVRLPQRKAVIDSVVVAPAHRGRGIGHGMIATAIDWARQREVAVVTVAARFDRVVGHKVYEDCGLSRSGYSFTTSLGPSG